MATLTVEDASDVDGVTPTFTSAAGGGDQALNDGKTMFYVKNGNVSPITVTFATTGKVQGLDIADTTLAVAASSEAAISGLDPGIHNDSNGMVQITYSEVTSVTIAVLRAA